MNKVRLRLPTLNMLAYTLATSMLVFPVALVLWSGIEKVNFFYNTALNDVISRMDDLTFILENIDKESSGAISSLYPVFTQTGRIKNKTAVVKPHSAATLTLAPQQLRINKNEICNLVTAESTVPARVSSIFLNRYARHIYCSQPPHHPISITVDNGTVTLPLSSFASTLFKTEKNEIFVSALSALIFLILNLWLIRTVRRNYFIEKTQKNFYQGKSSEDELSGLLNRFGFFREAERLRNRIGGRLTMMVDIDYFKRVNDTFGHPAGDFVIKSIAGVLRHATRGFDRALARTGGEEFCLLITGISQQESLRLAQQIRIAAGTQYLPLLSTGKCIQVTISVGAVFDESGKTPLRKTMKLADENLYISKIQGRNLTTLTNSPLPGATVPVGTPIPRR